MMDLGWLELDLGWRRIVWVLVEISRASPSNPKLILTSKNLFYGELLNKITMSEEGHSSLYSSYPLM
jgi:hypothetical protein